MKGIRSARLRQLIDDVEDDVMYTRVERTVAPAIDTLVFRIPAGGLVEFGVGSQEAKRRFRPRLVSKKVDLRNQPDPGRAPGFRDALDVIRCEGAKNDEDEWSCHAYNPARNAHLNARMF